MRHFKRILPFLAPVVAGFYLLPLLMQNTGIAMVLLLVALPLICLISGGLCGWRHSFQVLFPIAVALLFLPTLPLFYNASAWVYAPAYGVVALVGNGLGSLFRRMFDHKR